MKIFENDANNSNWIESPNQTLGLSYKRGYAAANDLKYFLEPEKYFNLEVQKLLTQKTI